MNRNPALMLTLLVGFALTGCGVNPAVRPVKASAVNLATQAARVLSTEEALRRVESIQLFKAPLKANKDWVMIAGKVSKILPDDLIGNRHQHFLFTVDGDVVKVAHNLELAPKVPVTVGDAIEVKCEFIKASPYDVAHWTHYDPRGGEGGFIKHRGKVYDRI